jgi:hypothetical protein
MSLKIIAKLILNEEKKISWTKLGLGIVAIAGVTLTIPALPLWIMIGCKYICAIGTMIFGSGCRDAYGKFSQQGDSHDDAPG